MELDKKSKWQYNIHIFWITANAAELINALDDAFAAVKQPPIKFNLFPNGRTADAFVRNTWCCSQWLGKGLINFKNSVRFRAAPPKTRKSTILIGNCRFFVYKFNRM